MRSQGPGIFQQKWQVGWPWLKNEEEKGMICEWCVANNQTLIAQNVLNSTRFIDGCTSYKTEPISYHEKSAAHFLAKQCHSANFWASENWSGRVHFESHSPEWRVHSKLSVQRCCSILSIEWTSKQWCVKSFKCNAHTHRTLLSEWRVRAHDKKHLKIDLLAEKRWL